MDSISTSTHDLDENLNPDDDQDQYQAQDQDLEEEDYQYPDYEASSVDPSEAEDMPTEEPDPFLPSTSGPVYIQPHIDATKNCDNGERFFLKKLPAEVRMEVYKGVFEHVLVRDREDLHSVYTPNFSILRSCELLYQEAKFVFYQNHVFSFETEAAINRLPVEKLEAIRHVDLYFGVDCPRSPHVAADTPLGEWVGMCRVVATLMKDLRTLHVYFRNFWSHSDHKDTEAELLNSSQDWAEGLASLRSMTTLKLVKGLIKTSVNDEVLYDDPTFLIRFQGLDDLDEAFMVTQPQKARGFYGRFSEW